MSPRRIYCAGNGRPCPAHAWWYYAGFGRPRERCHVCGPAHEAERRRENDRNREWKLRQLRLAKVDGFLAAPKMPVEG